VSKFPITMRNNRGMRFTELPLLLPEPDMLTRGSSYPTGRRGESQESCANVGKTLTRDVTHLRHAFVTLFLAMASSFFNAKAPSNKTAPKHTVDPALQPWVEK
jgi:hypothetical protein